MRKPRKPKTVLVVDDEPAELVRLAALLEDLLGGVEVLTASSSVEGLRIASGRQVDLVLADYRMPEMDGIDFLAQARMLNPRIRRVVFTGYAEPDEATRAAAEAMVDGFLSKDVEPEDLAAKLQTLLGIDV